MRSRHRPPPLLISLSIFLSCVGNHTALAKCLPDQSSALLHLKQGFSSSSKLGSWQPGSDCCTWDGVTCDSGRVTGLYLSNRSIAGNITSGLFNLTSLRTLNLAYNRFNRIRIPPSGFERLTNLTHLNLSNAGFVGQIPIGISRLTNLVSLDLSTFYVNADPLSSFELKNPNLQTLIKNLSNLSELYLDGVNISAKGKEWCVPLSESTPGLKILSLSGCSLSGPIDSSLSRLRNLSEIRLDGNKLKPSVPDFFGNFSSLSVLRLSFCRLGGVFPQNIFQNRNLRVVDLSSNPELSGSLPDFPEDSRLESLVLSYTNFTGFIPFSIGNLKFLSKLQLLSCQFYGAIPSSIGNLTQLVLLDLSFNSFTGVIPSSIPAGISKLILGHNSLTGAIPSSSFGNGRLCNLTELDLHNNSLSGPIPVSLFTLPSLQVLQLNLNQLSGQLAEFPNASSLLDTVDLSNNKLQGEIPRSVFQLSGLEILTLSSNNFSGTMELALFQSLTNLSSLDLSYNRLSIQDDHGNDNSSPTFPKIRTLKLVSCNLTKLPGFLRNHDTMSSLDLSNNRIGGNIPKWIWSIGNGSLNYLNLSYNLFTHVEEPPPNLSMVSSINLDLHSNMLQGTIPIPPPNTIVLDYSNNNFTSSIPLNFPSYLNFALFFSLANNSLTGVIPPSICNASFLQVLDFSDNNMVGPIPQCLMEGQNDLRVLNLRGNQLQEAIPQNISQGCVLRTINLNGNHLEGQVPRYLANCNMLEVLDLGNNHLVGSFPYWLGNISTLRVLVLRSNGFSGPLEPASSGIQVTDYTFPVLQIFDLSSNLFSGSLPASCFKHFKAMMVNSSLNHSTVRFQYLSFSQSYYQDTVTVASKGLELTLVKILTIFTSIDFSNNQFEGDIPEMIGELRSLYVLNFSKNSLTGPVPLQIGNLRQLESLDLSRNHLSGEIPQELTSLTFLSFLNLSYNNLVGRIPEGNQLSTFTRESFEGNEGLCGSPLSKQCSNASADPPMESQYQASKSVIDVNWEFVFIGLGYGGGMAMVIGLLMVWATGKQWFEGKVDKMLWAILPLALLQHCDSCGDGRVGAVEEMEEESAEVEGVPGRRFCVFCTKIEFYEGRMVIHHVECECPLEGE